MGIYFSNWVYHGLLIKKETYEKIKGDLRYKKFLNCLFSNTYILCVPNRCIKIGWIDPIIEGHELLQGFVSLNEITQKLKNDLPDKWQKWLSTKNEDLEELKHLIKLIDKVQYFGIYILECSYSSYSEILSDDINMTKNLKCI